MKDYGNRPTVWRENVGHIEAALKRWVRAGVLDNEIISRLFDGQYYWFVTFREASSTLKTDPAGYVVLTNVTSKAQAQEEAKRLFDGYWDEVLPEWEFEMADYPKREIGRHPGGEKVTLDV